MGQWSRDTDPDPNSESESRGRKANTTSKKISLVGYGAWSLKMHSWRYKRTETTFLCKMKLLVLFCPARAHIKKKQYMHKNLLSKRESSHATLLGPALEGRGGYPEQKVQTYLSKTTLLLLSMSPIHMDPLSTGCTNYMTSCCK